MVEQAMFWGGVSCLAYVSYFVKDAWQSRDPVTKDDMVKGLYFCAVPGCGKTTFLVNRAVNYVDRKWSLVWIEIQDGAKRLLRALPEDADVVYVCPWADKVVGINAMERDKWDSDERYVIADRVKMIFQRAYHKSWGDTIEGLIYNGALAVMEAYPKEQVTLLDMLRFFDNPGFRANVLNGVKNEEVKSFFNAIKSWDSESVNSSIRKFARLLTNESAKAVLAQKEGISLIGAMAQGKTVIFDFDSEVLGPSTASFLASVVLAQVEHAAFTRPYKSHPCAVFADEFQEYATESLASMIARARKKNIGVHLSHQSNAAQLSGSLSKAVHECATHMYGRLLLEDAQHAAKHCGAWKPFFKEEVKYTHEDFTDMPDFTVVVKRLHNNSIVRASRMKLPRQAPDLKHEETLIYRSNDQYAIDRDEALTYSRIMPDVMRGEKKK